MTRVFALLALGWMTTVLTGCVGPLGVGCQGPMGNPNYCDSCDSGCGDASCGGCDECTGCGELYIDPWINERADCVDPCDSCGNYNGQSCGKCRSVMSGWRSMWGYRCGCDSGPVPFSDRGFAPRCSAGCGGCDECIVEPTCGCDGACSCDTFAEPGCGLEPTCGCEGSCNCGSGVTTPGYAPMPPAMPYAPAPAEPVERSDEIFESPGQVMMPSPPRPYQPSRTRKIFRPRTQSARGFLNEYRR